MTKTEKKRIAREIKDRGNPISKKDVNFLITEIFSLHPEWKEKKGCALKSIFIGPDGYGKVTGVYPQGLRKVFKITFNDGTVVRTRHHTLGNNSVP